MLEHGCPVTGASRGQPPAHQSRLGTQGDRGVPRSPCSSSPHVGLQPRGPHRGVGTITRPSARANSRGPRGKRQRLKDAWLLRKLKPKDGQNGEVHFVKTATSALNPLYSPTRRRRLTRKGGLFNPGSTWGAGAPTRGRLCSSGGSKWHLEGRTHASLPRRVGSPAGHPGCWRGRGGKATNPPAIGREGR